MLYKELTFAPGALHSELQQQTIWNTVNTQKSPPWACDKGCAEACAERFSALNIKMLFGCFRSAPLITICWGFAGVIESMLIAELWRVKRACGAPWVSKSTHPRKFGNHVTVHRPPAARPSAPQAYQCLLSHFLATLGAQEKADCTSMLSSIDSCQNRVSADQYHLTVSRAQVSTHRGRVSFWSYPLTSY